MTTLHPSDEEALDTIDAMIFNGDSLHNAKNLERMQYFIDRWQTQLDVIQEIIEGESSYDDR